MDLKLSSRGDYVVRAAISLGRAAGEGGYRKIREVASEMGLPEHYTPQIMGLLIKAGLAESKAGKKGGYRLTRAPSEISLLDLVEAGEGPMWPRSCILSGGPCHWELMCAVHPALEDAYGSLSHALGRASLESVLKVDSELESGRLPVLGKRHEIETGRVAPTPARRS